MYFFFFLTTKALKKPFHLSSQYKEFPHDSGSYRKRKSYFKWLSYYLLPQMALKTATIVPSRRLFQAYASSICKRRMMKLYSPVVPLNVDMVVLVVDVLLFLHQNSIRTTLPCKRWILICRTNVHAIEEFVQFFVRLGTEIFAHTQWAENLTQNLFPGPLHSEGLSPFFFYISPMICFSALCLFSVFFLLYISMFHVRYVFFFLPAFFFLAL